ncbi:MAG: hypothetical protein H0T48_13775 [Gemmatimonadaceae bacterium]|nr:hypothetical protein [Gemmatimonadaceae bacterium]
MAAKKTKESMPVKHARRKLPKRAPGKAIVVSEPVPLSESETKVMTTWLQLHSTAAKPPAFRAEARNGKSTLVPHKEHLPDDLLWDAQLSQALGTVHPEAYLQLLHELHKVVGKVDGMSADGTSPTALNAALAQIAGIAPRDPLEGMLAVQMVGVHAAAMEHLSRSLTNDTDTASQCVARASRLLRIFSVQMDTLNRHRGKAPSEQRVVVEHVNVHDGGQAIVGNVTAPLKRQAGGGGETENV